MLMDVFEESGALNSICVTLIAIYKRRYKVPMKIIWNEPRCPLLFITRRHSRHVVKLYYIVAVYGCIHPCCVISPIDRGYRVIMEVFSITMSHCMKMMYACLCVCTEIGNITHR